VSKLVDEILRFSTHSSLNDTAIWSSIELSRIIWCLDSFLKSSIDRKRSRRHRERIKFRSKYEACNWDSSKFFSYLIVSRSSLKIERRMTTYSSSFSFWHSLNQRQHSLEDSRVKLYKISEYSLANSRRRSKLDSSETRH
jgi:hypothetical protein